MEIRKQINLRNAVFVLLCLVGVGMVYGPLADLLVNAQRGEHYSHILLIPLVTAYLIFSQRESIFKAVHPAYSKGLFMLIAGSATFGLGMYLRNDFNLNDYTALVVFSAVVFWIGAFVFSYGVQGFQAALFPLLFLAFMIPVPSVLMDNLISLLQSGSTEVTHALFALLGVSFVRDGFIFQLPVINIEVAKECSGIRSTIALFITGTLAGHYFLRTGWRKWVLLVAMLPITIFKNAVRIVTLSALAIYVDPKFITDSFLHHSGGFVFYIPALVLMGLILWYFRRTEMKQGFRKQESGKRKMRVRIQEQQRQK